MGRKKAIAAPVAEQPTDTATADVFDEAIEARNENTAAGIVSELADSTAMPDDSPARSHTARHPQRTTIPDPFNTDTISVGEGEDPPKIRFFRNNAKGVVAIQMDERPSDEHIQTLREAGFRWQAGDRVWEKPLVPNAMWQSHADGQKTFRELGDALREQAGLAATVAIGS